MFPKNKKSKQKNLTDISIPKVTSAPLNEEDFIMPSVVNWTGHSLISDPPPKTPSPTTLSPKKFPITPDTPYPQTPSPMPPIPKTPSIEQSPQFPKSNKRTIEQTEYSPSNKIPRMSTTTQPSAYPSTSAATSKISLNDIAFPSVEQDWQDIEDIINKPSTPKPIDLDNLESYANLAPIQDEDWEDIQSFMQTISNLQETPENIIPKTPPPPPPDMMFSDPPTLDDIIFPASKPPPISSDSSTFVYKTVFSGKELVDLSLTPLIVPPSDDSHPSTSKPSTPPPPILSLEQLADLNASATATDMSSANLLESLKPRHKSKKGEKAPKKPTDATNCYPENEYPDITSDQLFDILVYLSNSARDIIPINKNLFANMPAIDPLLDKYNKTVLSMRDYHLINSPSTPTSHMKRAYRNIGTFLKQTYISIYPAEKILALIESNPESLNCIWILEHELGLRELLKAIKFKIATYKSKYAIRSKTVEKRVADMRKLISAVIIEFKKIYKLP